MALIDKITDIRNFDYKKVRKPNTTENGTFKTNQKNNSEKNTSFDEGRVQQQYTKLSPDEDQFLKKEPGDRYRGTKLDDGFYRGGAALNVERNVEDVERIGKFLTTPKGLLFTTKQVILQKSNASEHTRGYKIESPITNRPPFNYVERHRGTTNYPNPKSYEEADFRRRARDETEGTINIAANKRQVQPVVLKSRGDKPRGILTIGSVNTDLQKEQKRVSEKITDFGYSVKDENPPLGNKLNPLITQNQEDVDKLPKDFIDFRIKDMVNNQFIQFPAYLTDITDNSSAEYNPTRYIGRPDQVFVYSGYTRNISFGFRVAALQEEDVQILWRKVDKLKLLTLPTFKTNEVITDGEERPVAPFVELTLGNLFREQPGYFSSVNVTIPQTSTWELSERLQLPHICDVAVEFTFIGRATPQNFKMTHKWKTTGGIEDKPSSFDLLKKGVKTEA